MFFFFSIRGSLFLGIVFWIFSFLITLAAFARFGWWALLICLLGFAVPFIDHYFQEQSKKRERKKAFEEIRKDPYKSVKTIIIK